MEVGGREGHLWNGGGNGDDVWQAAAGCGLGRCFCLHPGFPQPAPMRRCVRCRSTLSSPSKLEVQVTERAEACLSADETLVTEAGGTSDEARRTDMQLRRPLSPKLGAVAVECGELIFGVRSWERVLKRRGSIIGCVLSEERFVLARTGGVIRHPWLAQPRHLVRAQRL